ncbi:5-formyltetrahydrofolate cyclo-ligase [Amphibacillus marinus]|uniref:5-formyltetrahydrofolate cyclo-ligase n=1 Tax=Amphibacillus marinus TaxID=872970 RepID=A0A1H8HF97_9BACI|nr:5-formyltetrahydrofolate cyclo-ligase [Amphibacillus marinus]SEN54936.1 5-formyltetrahydrofolate cyclo-ligase [Amphibacillus marinus]
MLKATLRATYLTKLKELTASQKQRIQLDLYDQLFKSEHWQKADVIGLTIAQAYEWDTWPIIEEAWQHNKKVAVPKCYHETKTMIFHIIGGREDLKHQYYDLLEPIVERTVAVSPEEIDLLLVPGIVFDHQHYRIGHGGGYYDRFLKRFTQTTLSLVWSGQVIDQIPIDSYDLPVQYLIRNRLL